MAIPALFSAASFFSTAGAAELSEKYFLQLRYNHSSPFFRYTGIREISAPTAKRYPHYVFKYTDGKLSEIICNNPEYARTHPLTNIGAYRTKIDYDGSREIRTFFDAGGKRCANIRKVWTETFTTGSDGMYISLAFSDADGKPMQSEWLIAKYEWKKSGNMIVEHRYDLGGTPASVSPYFQFGTTGIRFSDDGTYRETFNLDEKENITGNGRGIASYRDRYDAEGNHLEYAYFDAQGKPTPSPWRYQKAFKFCDEIGNLTKMEMYDMTGQSAGTQKFNSKRELNPEGKAPDNKTSAGRNGVNLAIQYYEPEGVTAKSPMLVYIHGNSDGGVVNLTKGKINLLDWLKNIGNENKTVTVFLQRPGFRSEIGKSDGFEDKDPEYYNWITPQHVRYCADAVRSLHEAYPDRPIMIVGHSGGSRMAFSVAAYYPDIVKGVVLSACHVPEAASGKDPRKAVTGNPLDDYVLIPNDLPVHALTGDKDTSCPAGGIARVIDLLKQKGSRSARFDLVPGHTHFTIRPDSKELPIAVKDMADRIRSVK
jgi:pimeloyl-ACP methyl ester carboxylesterase